ncbi:MAG: HypC/HybG/HupF family hydrogenase formation chaperone, partial [Candidatus Lokiarchaeia archaeon]|nr:HypC/HybG/HupF family hydrogenase formation chaperone [Candidatus Lokiarchaeia archaeon]
MCLAIPGKIIEINNKESSALVDYGDGTKRRINISLVTVNIGDYVLVHAGFAIEKLNKNEAKK